MSERVKDVPLACPIHMRRRFSLKTSCDWLHPLGVAVNKTAKLVDRSKHSRKGIVLKLVALMLLDILVDLIMFAHV